MILGTLQTQDLQNAHPGRCCIQDPSLYLTSQDPREVSEVKPIERISNSKFPIYKALSLREKKPYAMKVFPYIDGKPNSYFLNESSFSSLSHVNVVSCKKVIPKQKVIINGNSFEASYILYELARCDFLHLVGYPEFLLNEKLVRTYFRQLIEGIEYLHSNGIYHMDLKPDNLLLGQDSNLKICDFDLAIREGASANTRAGTYGYRAPELKDNECEDPAKADIFSCGVLLFLLKFGCFPFLENKSVEGNDLFYLLGNKPETFWNIHKRKSPGVSYTESFKELFQGLVRHDPKKRLSINEIKRSSWYLGPVYSQEELTSLMEKILEGCVLC